MEKNVIEPPKVRCTMCEWEGTDEDLMFGEDDRGYFHGCPHCHTDAYLMDAEE